MATSIGIGVSPVFQLKKAALPSPDLYYDLSLKSNEHPTRNIIDDMSGNGRHATIYNALYAEGSGYGKYGYEGAFVFDGIDDYARIENITKGFKTLFMEVVPISIDGILYDQRVKNTAESDHTFAIFNRTAEVAYNKLNTGGVTYINGNLNKTILADELIKKRQVITIVNNTDIASKNGVLGAGYTGKGIFSNMALYKVIGFYDELTPAQIQKVITKYNLKYEQI